MTFPDFTYTESCSDPYFIYHSTLTAGGPLPSIISLNPTTKTYTITTSAIGDVGSY